MTVSDCLLEAAIKCGWCSGPVGLLAQPDFYGTTRSGALCLQAYELRGAGAVLHSHSLNAMMVTLLDEAAPEFTVTHLEMIKVRIKP